MVSLTLATGVVVMVPATAVFATVALGPNETVEVITATGSEVGSRMGSGLKASAGYVGEMLSKAATSIVG